MAVLAGKVALVTGSSRGIGRAIAQEFARQGASVALHGRDEAALEAVRHQITAAGGKATTATAAITSFEQLEALRQKIETELGKVDILVANAGGNLVPPGPVENIGEEQWRADIDNNLTGVFLTIKSFLPGMKERKSGNIITISSAAARRPGPFSPIPYAVSKAGIQLLTQEVAAQAGPFGIRVNCIAPETILTETNQARIPANVQQQLVETRPLKRLGQPEDVAQAALYLASDASSWITGVILDIAGGAVFA